MRTSTWTQEPQVAALTNTLAVEGERVQLGGFRKCFLAPVDIGHRFGGRRSGGRHVFDLVPLGGAHVSFRATKRDQMYVHVSFRETK